MEKVLGMILGLSKILNDVAGAALTFMMSITVADVFLRAGGHPIIGTYEIVALSGAIVIGFAIPLTSWNKGHVYMEFLLDRLSAQNKNILNTLTRVLCIILFVVIAVKLFQMGSEFRASGEVSPTIKIPIYPVVYAVGLCCVIECVVFVCDIVKIWDGKYE